ncbi:MAG: helix-turn-helix domain-containing protein [Cyclobacteriaceae bacterium]|jgi:AraC-like DNA-binding protein|nr:helix-turn-helix domain-containing protein [Flammeovirgaceae bacterium]
MNSFLACFISGASFLLSFLLFFHPFQQNIKANRWLGFFAFIIGCAFIGTYLTLTETTDSNHFLFKILNSLQFLLAPSFYFSILYFVKPTKVFTKMDWLHFLPFVIYTVAETIWNPDKESISTFTLFTIDQHTDILVRNILPLIALVYLIQCYFILKKHKNNLKRISSAINQISLDWLVQFLFILSITLIIWINDALFGLPYLLEATNFIYAIAIFFLAYFSIQQKTIFAFKEKDIVQISEVLEYEEYKTDTSTPSVIEASTNPTDMDATEVSNTKPKLKRLSAGQIVDLSTRLFSLMENDKLFLNNELNLPTVAEKLDISIHEASFLINEAAQDNFYNFINKYRVEEAKKLLASAKMEELNIVGIAFASGFNSKTTFNTTFKKVVGISPSQFSKQHKK